VGGGGKWHAVSPGADGASVENKKKGFGYRIVACNMMIVAGWSQTAVDAEWLPVWLAGRVSIRLVHGLSGGRVGVLRHSAVIDLICDLRQRAARAARHRRNAVVDAHLLHSTKR